MLIFTLKDISDDRSQASRHVEQPIGYNNVRSIVTEWSVRPDAARVVLGSSPYTQLRGEYVLLQISFAAR